MNQLQLQKAKFQMLSQHLMQRGITDGRVLNAMTQVPREEFVPNHLIEFSYQDSPLPIGFEQTISQPFVVALMCQLLNLTGQETVLDVGTGSGYQAAVLSKLAKNVITVEIIPDLAKNARKIFKKLNYKNIHVYTSDANKGYPKFAPYDAIKSAAATPKIPLAWINQLKDNGVIVTPKSTNFSQDLIRLVKKGNNLVEEKWGDVRFVPLVKAKS
ncbi:protein-L-isoaspartate O-methyltransferase [Candidatus Shapirobacteria bacterium RIFOXYD1_FULL_38_32]|uniref:Protein-L-isoaspartate O-methyltransferase n=2 Tax=Candidatus Shapironibacteriota TaxID=1752721 RepID=A0A0G0JQ45_9BACT|nr:MAG: Protein-L-isoaspartate O-methyltransferase [Candidatus Shapirobacteria bacterium GW2011_GWE2_38_30]OGL55982.1 MAG: protein-L-isoaspartate O-methyltransferase [Candidatus Shapirobacteria bacterium RIFOXYA1_FULL_39_17]OGL56170.1 MAG: protein-L-isoaspartate O-methyltransferase [Candidatus Shapirobacteria bacterium RIFOXYB1_FULL_38_38]OGL56799.1 MAG: protein-L-isoaspartate O-methyltransferase [Candidatus Shapirobacteria bacterium RIFOXYC1_FULL_38_24]OGL58370.1 MAG: protein-L-isoaspartate O-